jgi:hypothetical protein
MSLQGPSGRLAELTVDLVRHWERTRPFWRDAKGETFEKNTVDAIRSCAGVAVGAMQELDELMRKIGRDCE